MTGARRSDLRIESLRAFGALAVFLIHFMQDTGMAEVKIYPLTFGMVLHSWFSRTTLWAGLSRYFGPRVLAAMCLGPSSAFRPSSAETSA